jgi:8-oxo-dGTP pyrophosphatase MutT (NUDIX family)
MDFEFPQPPHHTIDLLQAELVHENPWWNVYFDHVMLPSGTAGRHLRLVTTTTKPGAVALVMNEFPDGYHVAFVSQWRYAQQEAMWELPRGFGEPTDASPAQSAAREVAEETGLIVTSTKHLGTLSADSSIIAGSVEVFFVEAHGSVQHDDEVSQLAWVPASSVLELCASGALKDSFTLAALALGLADPDIRPMFFSS